MLGDLAEKQVAQGQIMSVQVTTCVQLRHLWWTVGPEHEVNLAELHTRTCWLHQYLEFGVKNSFQTKVIT